jgi:N-acetylated-alpha-linked acidic dipeptidase
MSKFGERVFLVNHKDNSQDSRYSSYGNTQISSEKKLSVKEFYKLLNLRYHFHSFKTICGQLLTRAVLLLICVTLGLNLFYHSIISKQPKVPCFDQLVNQDFDYAQLAIETINRQEIREWSRTLTNNLHIAGKGKDLADWTHEQFKKLGIDNSYVESYQVYLNKPELVQLDLVDAGSAEIIYSAELKEEPIAEDPTTVVPGMPVFHGYSKSGEVTAQYVYANYGIKQDFDLLATNGISVDGKIVLVRYNRSFRGLKVKNAEERGAAGVVIFTDPTDDQGLDFTNGFAAYPDGPARHPSSVQRGNVGFLVAPGDPTTHGYVSTENTKRNLNLTGIIPSIPSIPISYKDAIPLLQGLNDKGDIFGNWTGILNATYSTGPSSNFLRLVNKQIYNYEPIYNVFGIVEGKNTDQAIVIGNHRDSWVVGGAADPNSGSAVLLALAKALGELCLRGWQPERTIILASWDGEEYGLLGSTEWGEQHALKLKQRVLSYVNVDGAVSGSYFKGGSSPSLNNLLRNVTKLVDYPDGSSLYEHWKKYTNNTISLLGTGSDYTVFLDYLGIPSIDFSFKPGRGDPIYHYHSNYDSFHFMDTRIDKDWKLHSTASKLLLRLTLELADKQFIEFDYEEYSNILQLGLEQILEKYDIENLPFHKSNFQKIWSYFNWKPILSGTCHAYSPKTYLECLQLSLKAFNCAATNDKQLLVNCNSLRHGPDEKISKFSRMFESVSSSECEFRTQSMYLERLFLVDKGLDSRSWYKHAFIAPNKETGYGASLWPGLLDAFEENDGNKFMKWARVYISMLDHATKKLTRVL